jgi:hypothetical protein
MFFGSLPLLLPTPALVPPPRALFDLARVARAFVAALEEEQLAALAQLVKG